jgi:hypothetical protein
LVHSRQKRCCTTDFGEIKHPATDIFAFVVGWPGWLVSKGTTRVAPLPLQQVAPGVIVSHYTVSKRHYQQNNQRSMPFHGHEMVLGGSKVLDESHALQQVSTSDWIMKLST